MPETLWWCPGVEAKPTKDGIELIFVRSRAHKRPKVDYPKTRKEGEVECTVTIPAKGAALLIRDGKKRVNLEDWKK